MTEPRSACPPTTVFLLHHLGGSAREWGAVIGLLDPALTPVAVDLAGFGEAAGNAGWSVEAMADSLADRIRAAAPMRYMLVGHSMGGKIAQIVARRAEDGETGLAGLAGIVLLAASPPEPEPMDEDRRAAMLGWFHGDDTERREQAAYFVDQNVAADLADAARAAAIEDVLRADPHAWRAWLGRGSREDWGDCVGLLQTPATIAAGSEDGDLGPEAQAATARRHFASATLATIAGAKHLLPIEDPDAVAALIAAQARRRAPIEALAADVAALIASPRTSARTQEILLGRLVPDADAPAGWLDAHQAATLKALLARIVPQDCIDLFAPVAKAVTGTGDGWRFADLPVDRDAYAAGLATLDAAASDGGFAGLDADAQDALLVRVAAGIVAGALDAARMKLWFEDVCAEATRAYVSHPATMARIGYGGFANGGDGVRKQGYQVLAAGEREPWEPRPTGATA